MPIARQASQPEGLRLRLLPEPYVNLSIHTAPDVRPLPWQSCQWAKRRGFARRLCLVHVLLLPNRRQTSGLTVGAWARLNNATPSVQLHYRTFHPTTDRSAPVLRIGTLILVDLATWMSPLASERQVLTFHTKA